MNKYCELIELDDGEIELKTFGVTIYRGLYDGKVINAVECALDSYMEHIGRITR